MRALVAIAAIAFLLPVNTQAQYTLDSCKALARANYIDAMRTVFVCGGPIGSVQGQVIVLGVIGLVMKGWAVGSYRKNG